MNQLREKHCQLETNSRCITSELQTAVQDTGHFNSQWIYMPTSKDDWLLNSQVASHKAKPLIYPHKLQLAIVIGRNLNSIIVIMKPIHHDPIKSQKTNAYRKIQK